MIPSASDICRAAVLVCTLTAADVRADGHPLTVSGSVRIASDYVFRGVSQTNSGPTLQALLETGYGGMYTYAWLSNVDFVEKHAPDDGADVEVNLAFGISGEIGQSLSVDARLVHYTFPGVVDDIDYDYTELITTIWIDDIWRASVAYSNDVFGKSEPGWSYALGAELELPLEFSLDLELGHYDLNDAYQGSYSFYDVGISRPVGCATLAAAYHGTTGADRLFGPLVTDGRVVVSLDVEF